MAQSSLLGWANSVRLTMASDPGRKLFQEQVQTHGFSFLDDYLDNILFGAKQDPLIELVKTPSRKKAIARKPKLASKMTQVVTLSLEDDNDSVKEINAPTNSFQQALLNVQGSSNLLPKTDGDRDQVSPITQEPTGSSSQLQSHKQDPSGMSANIQPNELSVIAEDDEVVERDQTATEVQNKLPSHEILPTPAQRTGSASSLTQLDILAEETTTRRSSTSSFKSFHSVPDDQPSPHATEESSTSMAIDITVPIRDPENQPPSSPRSVMRKSTLPVLPTLPEPIPLRKSTRITRDPSAGNVILAAATPGAGKRTSWLMKARETKAMEMIPKKSTIEQHITQAPPTSKRKSEEKMDSDGHERLSKALKTQKDDSAPLKATSSQLIDHNLEPSSNLEADSQDGMLVLLKKKVQVLEARNEKLGNKANDGAAAALAEARAQAEARIAERHKEETSATNEAKPNLVVERQEKALPPTERRFSVSDLFPSEGQIKDKSNMRGKNYVHQRPDVNRESTSTTPPHSPPSFAAPTAPVFNKPPPVFIPPVPSAKPLPTLPVFKEEAFTLPQFSKPTFTDLGLSPQLQRSTTNKPLPLSAQSTAESIQSISFFDRGNTEAWVPSTQDTEYSTALELQQQHIPDEDDSWPIDEKLPHGVHWPFAGPSKEDSMTWSTLPSESQQRDTRSMLEQSQVVEGVQLPVLDDLMNAEGTDIEITSQVPELEEIILGGTSTLTFMQSNSDKDKSILASSESSQSQAGFFGQASKFLSSALGTSKKKPEVKKVMDMAAAAAKKQQQEDDKKAMRLKEMENRRQLAIQRKAEEELSREQEQERKIKEEMEKRKREREEQVEKKTLKATPSSTSLKDNEPTKKRKLDYEKSEKKSELKKQTPLNKIGFKPTSSKHAGALSSSAAYNSSQAPGGTLKSAMKSTESLKYSKVPTAIPTKGKSKASPKTLNADEEIAQPSQILQNQMAARAKAAMRTEPIVPSESIELPEVNSEYSDSEDEDRPRTFNPPEWAQSPELRQALQAQSTINPDDIFGAIRPLRMEEMFKARTSRFRARTSSANWSGTDRLTVKEEKEYAKRMGFK